MCGIRGDSSKRPRDADDAFRLVHQFTLSGGTVQLSEEQKKAVKEGLPTVLRFMEGETTEEWWMKSLGL